MAGKTEHACFSFRPLAAWVFAILVFGVCFATPYPARGAERVFAWSYYVYPPFYLAKNQGLGADLVSLLNARAGGRFVFELEMMPRKRIDLHLAADDPGIVLFVSPEWLTPPMRNDFVWTGMLFPDRNGLLFSGLREVEYTGPESLSGMTLGGVVGRRYKGLDEAVADGLITRHDALSEEHNVRKLAERRIDVMTAPESTLRYLVDKLGVDSKVHLSETPLFEYTRHILVNNLSPEARDFILDFVRTLPEDPAWQDIKTKYNLP